MDKPSSPDRPAVNPMVAPAPTNGRSAHAYPTGADMLVVSALSLTLVTSTAFTGYLAIMRIEVPPGLTGIALAALSALVSLLPGPRR